MQHEIKNHEKHLTSFLKLPFKDYKNKKNIKELKKKYKINNINKNSLAMISSYGLN